MKDREAIFNDHISDLRKKEKEERNLQKEKVCSSAKCLYICGEQTVGVF